MDLEKDERWIFANHWKRSSSPPLEAAREDGSLSLETVPEPALERPRDEANGDWASTVAMRSAKLARKNPREIAQIIVDHVPANDMIAGIEIAGPGLHQHSPGQRHVARGGRRRSL